MSKNKKILLLIGIFVITSLACSVPFQASPPESEPRQREVEPATSPTKTGAAEQAQTVEPSGTPDGKKTTSQNTTIGTIQANLNGESKTWYVLSADVDGEIQTTAHWYIPDISPNQKLVSVVGYDSPDIPFYTFTADLDTGEYLVGDYQGSQIHILFELNGDKSQSFDLPTSDLTAGVTYLPHMAAGEPIYNLEPGKLEISQIQFQEQGLSNFTGTLHGTLVDYLTQIGEPLEITEGHWSVESLPFRDVNVEIP